MLWCCLCSYTLTSNDVTIVVPTSSLCRVHLDFSEVLKHRVDHLEGLVNFFSYFGSGQDNLATHEDQKHDFRLDHSVDETREKFRLVRAEVHVARSQTFETNGEFDIAGAHDVLDLEIRKLGVEAQLLDDSGILAGSELRNILRLGAGHDHLARGEDQGGGFRLADTHDHGGETLG
jgi:hypothetical protein